MSRDPPVVALQSTTFVAAVVAGLIVRRWLARKLKRAGRARDDALLALKRRELLRDSLLGADVLERRQALCVDAAKHLEPKRRTYVKLM